MGNEFSSTRKRFNLMGSEVEEGYACKPKKPDPNKPIMFYKAIVYVCCGERCAKAGGEDKAAKLREIVRDLGLHKGEKRIKISRTFCQGACRFRLVAQINSDAPNQKLWLKRTHRFSEEEWREIFRDLAEDRKIEQNLIEMRVYE